MPPPELQKLKASKALERRMLAPDQGGSYEIFKTRPLPQALVDYAVGDVALLPQLVKIYEPIVMQYWIDKIDFETDRRLWESRSAGYNPNGVDQALGPRRWWSLVNG